MDTNFRDERFTPQPTWYKGTLFRSKSEAIFARALELRGFMWAYEPDIWTADDGWKPDFWALIKREDGSIASLIIEYKPAAVTITYKERIVKRFASLGQRALGHYLILAHGTPFDLAVPRCTLKCCSSSNWSWENIEEHTQLFAFIDEAAKHRFDLDY